MDSGGPNGIIDAERYRRTPWMLGRLSERRIHARRWLAPATLGETKNVLAYLPGQNFESCVNTSDVAMIYNSGVGS